MVAKVLRRSACDGAHLVAGGVTEVWRWSVVDPKSAMDAVKRESHPRAKLLIN